MLVGCAARSPTFIQRSVLPKFLTLAKPMTCHLSLELTTRCIWDVLGSLQAGSPPPRTSMKLKQR